MSYKCLNCGHIFEWCEAKEVKEDYGYEYCCPICDGDFKETVKCSICKGEFLEDELNGGVCDECIDEYRKNFNACYEASLDETVEIKINALLASLFDVRDIEQILKEYIRDKWQDVDCSQFIDEDISWFGEMLSKEVKKNENKKN